MKKLFLIPLMTLVCSVMAWGADAHVSTIADLNAKLADASIETIYLDADLTYTTEACINILRSVTIDGQGHKISGGGIRTGSTKSTLAINQGAPDNGNWIELVTLRNITLQNAISAGQALNVRCNLTKLVIENSTIKTTGSGNNQPITFGGNQSTPVDLTINDSYISSGQAGYPLITFNPIALKTKNTTYKGYCSLYFKGVNSSAGSGGSSVDADACDFDAPNMNEPADGWNSFGTFAIADGGITFNLNNCSFNSQEIGSDEQQVFLFKAEAGSIASIDPCVIHITGDNSHINGRMLRDAQQSTRAYFQENYDPNAWKHVIEITGGTYAEDPSLVTSGDLAVTVPTGYEVAPVDYQDGETTATLYRVHKAFTSTDINQDNANAAVNVQGNTKLDADKTVNYVEVSNGATMTIGEGNTLKVTNGLDVQGSSRVVVEAGSALMIGEGGVVSEDVESIVIEADETGAGSFLMDPSVDINSQPNLTVKMLTKVGQENGQNYWHRFAMPVTGISSWTKLNAAGEQVNYGTWLYGWDYENNAWEKLPQGVKDMQPYTGYTLTHDEPLGTEVTYVFQGNQVGNLPTTLNLKEGFNFFGNSYTGYIDMATLLTNMKNDDNNIQGTAWMWNVESQGYQAVSLYKLQKGKSLQTWQKEVAPMQTFILQLTNKATANGAIDYASAIWGNPRYGNVSSAPARMMETADNYVEIKVTDEKGLYDVVDFTENAAYTDAYEDGADAPKFMNENHINVYSTIGSANYSSVVTNSIEGKMISVQAAKGTTYTLSFSNVEGTVYAIKDMVTGTVTEMKNGNTYSFTASENATAENRFMIVNRSQLPAALDNVEASAARKGIYTVMGQYLGETGMFNTLPAGVYVVDGIKVIK